MIRFRHGCRCGLAVPGRRVRLDQLPKKESDMPFAPNAIVVDAAASKRVSVRTVVLVGFNGMQALDLVGPLEVFTKAAQQAPEVGLAPFRYALQVASPGGGTVVTNCGLQFAGVVALTELPSDIDTIMVAGGSVDALQGTVEGDALLGWLRPTPVGPGGCRASAPVLSCSARPGSCMGVR